MKKDAQEKNEMLDKEKRKFLKNYLISYNKRPLDESRPEKQRD